MPENRYTGKNQEHYSELLDLTPSATTMRVEQACELKKVVKDRTGLKILDLGCGDGDLSKYLLEYNPGIALDCLDVSPEMLNRARDNLAKYGDRVNLIEKDAIEYLKNNDFGYDVINSAWTIHNFRKSEQRDTFQGIHNALNDGGTFLLMEKIYPDDKDLSKKLLNLQLSRYRYLDSGLCSSIVNHELQDYGDEFRMSETESLDMLSDVGFKNIRILDRIERDILLVANK